MNYLHLISIDDGSGDEDDDELSIPFEFVDDRTFPVLHRVLTVLREYGPDAATELIIGFSPAGLAQYKYEVDQVIDAYKRTNDYVEQRRYKRARFN